MDVAAEDLVVLEDGIEQKVEVFQEAVAPVSVMLVLDESGSMKRDAPMVMESARKFVESLPDKDKLAVMLFADKTDMVHDLTTDPRLGAGRDQEVFGQGRHGALRRGRRELSSGSRASRAGARSSS